MNERERRAISVDECNLLVLKADLRTSHKLDPNDHW